GPVRREVVDGRADDCDVDALELCRIVRVRHPGEREETCVVGLVRKAGLLPAFEGGDHWAVLRCLQGEQTMVTRERVQPAARVGALAFVVLWLFSTRLQGLVPFWLPFV